MAENKDGGAGSRSQILKKVRDFGADIAGIAPVERFAHAPLRMSPRGLLPSARSVIVAGIHHPDACVELGGEPSPHDIGPYGVQMTMNSMLDDISYKTAVFLEDNGYRAIPVAASNIWRYNGYKDLKVDFAPDLVHRYAAVAAGLGEIGWNGLFLTDEFGPRQRVVSIVTEADIEPDPMYHGPPACDRCMACVNACPTDAFRKEVGGLNRVEIGGRIFEFPDTNKWRCSWAENFCLSLDHEIPDKVDEETCLKYLEKYGFRGGEAGSCLKFCMSPSKRRYDESYSKAPRRAKEEMPLPDGEAHGAIEKICSDAGVDFIACGGVERFKHIYGVNPALHLPDVKTIISIGARLGERWKNNREMAGAVKRSLDYASFGIARYFDLKGYSAVCGTKISDRAAAEALGARDKDFVFTTVLTGAELSGKSRLIENRDKLQADKPGIKQMCFEAGADMAGVFSVERFNEFFSSSKYLEKTGWVLDDTGYLYGRFFPEAKQIPAEAKSPGDWLAGARSVIVLGVRFPDAPLDFAKITPAETVGPFAFVNYESLRLGAECALKVVKSLSRAGVNAVFTADMSGLGSQKASSRGRLPDLRANALEAILAGLAYPGVHGHALTEESGVRQRFIAVVTDLELESDPVYRGPVECDDCEKQCISACPVNAVGAPVETISAGGRDFILPNIDCFACDWAKLYCMSGKEGPEYYGLAADEPVPSDRTPEHVAEKLSGVEWGMQKRHINIMEDCIRVCPAGRRREYIKKNDKEPPA